MKPTCVLDNLGSLTGITLTSISDQDEKNAEHLLEVFGSSRKGFEARQVASSLRNAISIQEIYQRGVAQELIEVLLHWAIVETMY